MADWTLDGGNNDTFGTSLSDLIFGEGGNDTLRGSSTGTSTTDNDSLYGGEGNDSLDGGSGDDLISGGAGADTLDGGAGFDTLSYASDTAGVGVTINTGNATGIAGDALGDVVLGSSFEAIEGGSGNDSLISLRPAATLYGQVGNDSLSANLSATSTSSWLFGGIGEDALWGSGGSDSLVGGEGNDSLGDRVSTGGNNSLSGCEGEDTLVGQVGGTGAANYTLDGGAGNDSLVGSLSANGSAADSLFGGVGDDTLVDLGGFINRLDGGTGNDSLFAGVAADTLAGGVGADTLDGGDGADSLVGGADDLVSYARSAAALNFSLTAPNSPDGDLFLGTFGGVIGGSGNDSLYGNAGNNTLIGNAGADLIDGGDGNDLVLGGAGNDTLIGGLGIDTLSYADSSADLTVFLPGGLGGSILPGSSNSIGPGFEFGIGGSGNDTFFGNQLVAETMLGGAGNDFLVDTGGGNLLDGGLGNDSLYGLSGSNTLLGGAGTNLITAGGGADSILGGGGQDSVTAFGGDDVVRVDGLALGRMTLDGGDGNDMLDLGVGAWTVGSASGFTTYSFDDGSGGAPDSVVWTTGVEQVICFYPGTLVATPAGPRAVESLAIGDAVLTAEGAAAPVRWMGRQTVSTRFGHPLRVLPIRIAAGALGEGLPMRDLLVSPDHAILVGGVLVQAGALINGVTIRREAAVPERFTYHHVELATHALILAEGVPAETFVDNVDRGAFDNWAEHEALYGHLPPLAEMPRPRAKSRRQVPVRVLAMLDERAGLRAAG